MRLKGVIDYSMGNFLCVRGFAPMIELCEISESIQEIQRPLIDQHKGEMQRYLSSGEFTFFPEVILCADFAEGDLISENINVLRESVTRETAIKNIKIAGFTISSQIKERKKLHNSQSYDRVQAVFLDFDKSKIQKLLRIDGNHRLSAVDENSSYKELNIPFCLLLFRNNQETEKFCRALFHNINYKQIPLTMEQNLKLIIESAELFDDETLKNDPSFGYHYYLARKLYLEGIDFGYVPNIKSYVEKSIFTFLVEEFKILLDQKLLKENEESVVSFKSFLGALNEVIGNCGLIITEETGHENIAIIGALAFYYFKSTPQYNAFLKWISKNNIGVIKGLHLNDVIGIYDRIYAGLPKRVFLARWYPSLSNGDELTKANYRLTKIKDLVENTFNLEFIDLGTEESGTYSIRTKMYNDIKVSDIFIADLTGLRSNVMIELGYALHHVGTGRMLLLFQPLNDKDKVPFDLSDFRYEEIVDSAQIEEKVKPKIQAILDKVNSGEI